MSNSRLPAALDVAASAGGQAAMRLLALDITLSAIKDFAYIFDLNGRFLYANPALLDLWGLQLEEAVGKNFFELPYPEDLAATLQRQIQQVIETREVVIGETSYTSPGGVSAYYEYIFSPVCAADGTVEMVGGSTRDITDRKRAQDQLRESEERATNIVESITDGFMTVDRQWRVTHLNPRGEEITRPLQKSKSSLLGKDLWEEFPEMIGTVFEESYRRAMRDQVTVAVEGYYAPLDSWIEVRVYPSREGISLYFLDVTDRRLAQEAVGRAAIEASAAAEANAKFRAFFEQGTHYAAVMTLDGTVLEANRLSLEACGFARDEVIGRKFWECGWWSPSQALADLVRKGSAQAASGQLFQTETHYFIADRTERIGEFTLAPVMGTDGRVIFIAATGADITEKRRFADERERLLEAERSARSDAERASFLKDEFLATLSHELRTPLNAILGWTQILNGNRDEEDLNEGLKTIERNARAQTQIIEDLLDMSRIISGKVMLKITPIDLPAVVESALETTRHAAAAKGVQIEAILDRQIGPASGDPNRLQQVFWNLLTNAIKFTPHGGHVRVLLKSVRAHAEISVIDSGEGIAREFLPHVFDRFRQADASTTRRHGGLGLGLSIVKQLVELHGGSVRVRSNGLGHGSTFTIVLPLNALAPELQSTPQSLPSATNDEPCARLNGVRVLVLDDERDSRTLIKRLLEGCHAVVTTASTVGEAIELLRGGRFHVLVSDIGMPGEDGYSFIRRVRALGAELGGETPAVALTAYARAEDRVKAVMAGFQHHVVKPVDPGELIAMIASLAPQS